MSFQHQRELELFWTGHSEFPPAPPRPPDPSDPEFFDGTKIRSGTRYSSQTLPVRVAAAIRNLVGRKLALHLRRPTRFAYRLTIYTARRIP